MEVIIDGVKYAPVQEPKQDKPVFNAGDKVRVKANTCGHDSAIGSIITIEYIPADWRVCDGNRPAWKIEGSDCYISERDMEPYTEPKQDKPEVVKLYCVKDYDPGHCLTRGKVYEYRDGKVFPCDRMRVSPTGRNYAEWSAANKGLAACLYPLVSRPAKVGEWVRAIKDSNWSERFKQGDLLKCTSECEDCETWYGKAVEYNNTKYVIKNDEYLVIDGYDGRYEEPEYEWVEGVKGFDSDLRCRGYQFEIGRTETLDGEEKECSRGFHFSKTKADAEKFYPDNGTNRFCKVRGYVKKGYNYTDKYCARKLEVVEEIKPETKYYSGKVVCVDHSGYNLKKYTVGKVYTIENGFMIDCDDGYISPSYPCKTFGDWCSFSSSKFIEFKG